jgi:hypothetical protein
MQKRIIATASAAGVVLTAAFAAGLTYAPATRTQILSHNAFPDHGKFADRLDRTLAAGLPVAIEEDLAWVDGKSLLIHGAKAFGSEDPTFESYVIPKIKPIMEGSQRWQQRQLALITSTSISRTIRPSTWKSSTKCWTSMMHG